MESKKFHLNPNAPVFVPSNLASSQGKTISLDDGPADQGAKGVARSLQNDAPSNANVFSELFELNDLSQVTGDIPEFMEDPFPSGSDEQAKISLDDTVASDLRSLSLMFPGYSEESILDVYAANDGDIEAAMEMLVQLEVNQLMKNLHPDICYVPKMIFTNEKGVGDKSMSWPVDGSKSCSSIGPGTSGH